METKPKEISPAELKQRWNVKKDQIEMLANNIQGLRLNLTKDLKSEDEKLFLTALVISVMDKTAERVGNDESANNGHYGVTGMEKKHIKVNGDKIHFKYIGKSGVEHEKEFTDSKLANALKRAIANTSDNNVFTTSDGFSVNAAKVNRYLKEFNVRAKDLRGYAANKWVIEKLKSNPVDKEEKDRKKKFNEILKSVSEKIGHGKATLRKHYLIPELETNYIEMGKIIDVSKKDSYEKGGPVTTDGKKGGWLKGKRHYSEDGKPLGGIPAVVGSGEKPVELEGGEVIINREASKKHWKELSRINQSAGDGVPIGPPEADADEYKKGGNTIEFNPNHLPNRRIYDFAKMVKSKYPKVWDLGGNEFGNEAYVNLERAIKRGYWTDSEEWMYIKWRGYVARHKGDYQIAGVIAMLKWVDKVGKGWPYMKKLIEDEIKKRYSKDKMKTGGEVEDEGIDLFEDYENIPKKVQTILDKYAEEFGDDLGNMDYNDMAKMHDEVYAVGYTFESGLDNQPFDLRPIGTKGKSEVDEFKKGGELIKRADGSYSKRGLWDNIRDNAGSGKKATKEMLEQEEKIKNQMKRGGGVEEDLLSNIMQNLKKGYHIVLDNSANKEEPYTIHLREYNKQSGRLPIEVSLTRYSNKNIDKEVLLEEESFNSLSQGVQEELKQWIKNYKIKNIIKSYKVVNNNQELQELQYIHKRSGLSYKNEGLNKNGFDIVRYPLRVTIKSNQMKRGGGVEEERKVFYSIWNNYVGKLEIGSYKVETQNSYYDNVFLSLSDALKGLFDFIKEGLEYGNYSLAKEYPKSKFTVEQIDTSKKPSKYEDFYKKVVYTITAKEVLDLHKINRLKNGGELTKGIETEQEHKGTLEKLYQRKITPSQAPKSIAEEHLKEDKNYYTKLSKAKLKTGGLAIANWFKSKPKVSDEVLYNWARQRLDINLLNWAGFRNEQEYEEQMDQPFVLEDFIKDFRPELEDTYIRRTEADRIDIGKRGGEMKDSWVIKEDERMGFSVHGLTRSANENVMLHTLFDVVPTLEKSLKAAENMYAVDPKLGRVEIEGKATRKLYYIVTLNEDGTYDIRSSKKEPLTSMQFSNVGVTEGSIADNRGYIRAKLFGETEKYKEPGELNIGDIVLIDKVKENGYRGYVKVVEKDGYIYKGVSISHADNPSRQEYQVKNATQKFSIGNVSENPSIQDEENLKTYKTRIKNQ